MHRMMKVKKMMWIGIPFLLVLAIALHVFLSNQKCFYGNRIKNPDCYILEIEKMNGTDSHVLELKKGDSLQIYFATMKGLLNMEIQAPDGTIIYSGDGTVVTDYAVDVSADGVYKILVEAKKARGNISVSVAK